MTSAASQFKCFNCSEELKFSGLISRRDECPKCKADVRACKNCQFYDPKVYNECRETQADPVREKDRSNLCDYFSPGTKSAGQNSRDALLAAAEALFKKN
jgi:hypothetical protein